MGTTAQSADYFVAPSGDDSNPGTASQPFESIQKAVDIMSAGDLTYVREGTYRPSGPVQAWNKSGSADNPIRLEGYPGERPIIEWDGGTSNWDSTAGVLLYSSSYWIVRNFEIRQSPYMGIDIYGVDGPSDNNVIEDVEVHHNNIVGVGIGGTATGNELIDVITHHNYDFQSGGENADGIQISGTGAQQNLVQNCRSYYNSDDGIDLWETQYNTVERCMTWRNGYDENGTELGDGNGFKLGGGEVDSGNHTIKRCVAFDNRDRGFDSNGANRSIAVHNCTAWNNNGPNYRIFNGTHELRNNISRQSSVTLSAEVDDQYNSWNLDIDDPRFKSTDPNTENFLRLSSDSPLRNAGTDVGLSFSGPAPDLGAFEHQSPDYRLTVYDGSEFKSSGAVKIYDGSEWTTKPMTYFDGEEWKPFDI